MSNVNAPRGFRLVREVDGRGFNGALNSYALPSGYATNLFIGDAVKHLTTGYLAKAAAGDQIRGVVAGINWLQTNGVPSLLRYWPASTVTLNAQDAEILVIDDPDAVFEAAFTNSTSVPAFADKGANFNLYDAGGSTSSGLSGEGIDYTTLTTSAAQFRFLEFVRRADNDTTSAYSRGLFTPALHDYRVNTGI